MENIENKTLEIREHHYYFVQRELYDFIQRHTEVSFNHFCEPNLHNFAIKLLKAIWYETYTELGNIQKVDFDGITFSVTNIDELRTLVVLTLPVPQAMTESYFVGIVYGEIKTESRYFTLEYDDENKTSLCELRDGQHLLLDFDKILSKEEFIKKILGMV